MYEARIPVDRAVPVAPIETLEPVHAMVARLAAFADVRQAPKAGLAPSLAARYAAASPVARRRFDAVLREAETIGVTGLRLMAGRNGKADAGTVAAARFLGNSLGSALRKLDDLLPAPAA